MSNNMNTEEQSAVLLEPCEGCANRNMCPLYHALDNVAEEALTSGTWSIIDIVHKSPTRAEVVITRWEPEGLVIKLDCREYDKHFHNAWSTSDVEGSESTRKSNYPLTSGKTCDNLRPQGAGGVGRVDTTSSMTLEQRALEITEDLIWSAAEGPAFASTHRQMLCSWWLTGELMEPLRKAVAAGHSYLDNVATVSDFLIFSLAARAGYLLGCADTDKK